MPSSIKILTQAGMRQLQVSLSMSAHLTSAGIGDDSDMERLGLIVMTDIICQQAHGSRKMSLQLDCLMMPVGYSVGLINKLSDLDKMSLKSGQ